MTRENRYDILFEPVQIGPVTAKNRFYQVPHCNGMGYRDPTALAVMRGIKAEGGWAVVCTEQVEFHPSSEITPFIELRLWDDRDIPMIARIMDKIHAHGALGGVELCYPGMNGPNLYTREVPMGPAHLPVATFTRDPVQARAMTKVDISNLRRWHRDAAIRAKKAGADIVYVYTGKYLSGLTHFLSRRYNHRTDEYGGSLENRTRLVREIIEDTKEAVGDTCGIVCRISVDDLMGEAGLHQEEVTAMIALLDEFPDAWDLTLSGWENDSQTSRFTEEAYQEPYVATIKQVSKKPIIGVGRFTSPDTMVRQIKNGILDMIGAARPSIADPFLPKKIEEGRLDDIRECIGCNICVSGDFTSSPIRCTQNPTMGEEWRRGWHPERIRPKTSESKVLVVGAGPAGLEAALALGRRGYEVVLAEATTELGGRVAKECRLPGLSAWGRVRDYRQSQLQKMPNVEIYYDSKLSADDILEFGCEHTVIATGATWRRDGVARFHTTAISIDSNANVLTPDDLMAGTRPQGKDIVLYDDDHYYMGGVLAELLTKEGYSVSLVTPAADVSNWTHNTMEQHFIQTRLIECGVNIVAHRALVALHDTAARTACVFTRREQDVPCDTAVLVTARLPNDGIYLDLISREPEVVNAGIQSVRAIGDAWAPATIAAAVFEGHKYAETIGDGADTGDAVPFKRELTELSGIEA
jgi:dimethylamine/trimethylamine dehydrogenase